MDPARSARAENLVISRDRIQITLTDGIIQFTQPVNGVVFGAVFHGSGRLQAEPPNPVEAQQLRLLTKQDKLDMPFTDATFSFTDDLFGQVAKQVKWQPSGTSGDDLYARRQKEREDLGAEYLPRLFKSLLSNDPKRTAYFLADLKTKERGWVEVRDDARHAYDDPAALQDFLISSYQINAYLADNADLNATADPSSFFSHESEKIGTNLMAITSPSC